MVAGGATPVSPSRSARGGRKSRTASRRLRDASRDTSERRAPSGVRSITCAHRDTHPRTTTAAPARARLVLVHVHPLHARRADRDGADVPHAQPGHVQPQVRVRRGARYATKAAETPRQLLRRQRGHHCECNGLAVT